MENTTDRKRVGILLRVSTEMQVSETNKQDCDIPTQRIECMRFIEKQPNWYVEKEYVEIGISGFKNRMSERDKINEIIDDIEHKKIDVLLVFMFDRLARSENEAPAVVKNLVMMGAEVWSVKEGQMKFDSHIDSLMNFITFWQAAGESKKTSERVTAAMSQMAEQGQYTGGKPPYGYMAVETGKLTKKKLPEKMLVICEDEARLVRIMFDMVTTKGYGCRRVAEHLNRTGYRTKTGKQWQGSTIAAMMQNPIYKGTKAYKRTTTKSKGMKKGQWRTDSSEWILAPYNPDLAIVTEEQWNNAANVRAKNGEGREKGTGTTGGWTKLLLIGFIYCGCCGAALSQGYTSYSWKTEDGKTHWKSKPTYKCGAKASGKLGCEGRSVYTHELIEGVVIDEVCNYLNHLEGAEIGDELVKIKKDNLKYEESVVKALVKEIHQSERRMTGLEEEIFKIIAGDSALPREKISEMLEKETVLLEEKKVKLKEAQTILSQRQLEYSDLEMLQKLIPVWTEVFEGADADTKKHMLSKIIERVNVWPDKIEVKLRMEIEDFLRLSNDKAAVQYNCTNGRPHRHRQRG